MRRVALLLLLSVVCAACPAGAAPRGQTVHVVVEGQTLGRIAKRYGVTVEAIVQQNALRSSYRIRPGQKLVIPGPGAAQNPPGAGTAHRPAAAAKRAPAPMVHTVASGHTLGKIGKRYHVSIDALCNANGIRRNSPLKPGQRLVIPSPEDEDGSEARAALARAAGAPETRRWQDYSKRPRRRGYVTLEANGRSFRGHVVGPKGSVLPAARERMSRVLASWRTGKHIAIEPRLLLLIARVSDAFGGRTVRVVSGYREHSYSAHSQHPLGGALDFSIDGVPNWAVRDYLRTLPGLGVGYYPNSTFVHMDVRGQESYWVDESGPGEPPRYAGGGGE